MLIVITGTPGTGKTAVAKLLARKLKAKVLDVKEIALANNLILGYDEKTGSLVINNKKLSKAVKKEIKIKEKDYILDSHLGHFVKPEIADWVFVLRCSPEKLEKRLKKRRYSEEKIRENVMAEKIDVCLIEAIKQGHEKHLHEVDTTRLGPKGVFWQIYEVINGKKKNKFGETKWLK